MASNMKEAGWPLRLVCSDELGVLKGEGAQAAAMAPPAPQDAMHDRPQVPCAVVQTPDGTKLDGAAVVASW